MLDNTNTCENGVKASMHFMKAIENNEVEELNNLLENESISKVTLGAGLMKALQNYRNSSDTIDIIDSLLNHNADPNYIVHYKNTNHQVTTADRVTILMYACHKGDLQLIHTILKHNPNVNSKDANNRNALFYAINADKGDNADIVLTLINSGISVNDAERENKDGGSVTSHSPLTLATQKNMRNIVRILLDNGAEPNWTVSRDGNTALHYAVKNSNLFIIEKLLEKNANLRAINKENLTPLSLALKLSHTDIYKLLVEKHNMIVKKESEMANTLIIEHENNTLNSNPNSAQKGKKKKSSKDQDQETPNEKPEKLKDISDIVNNEKVNLNKCLSENLVNKEIDSQNENQNQNQNLNQKNKENQNEKENKNENLKKKETIIVNEQKKENSLNLINEVNSKESTLKLDLINKIKEIKLNNFSTKKINKTINPSRIKRLNQRHHQEDTFCTLEMPFEITQKLGESNSIQYQSYLKFNSTPTLYLDFSNKKKEENAILFSKVEELSFVLNEKGKEIKHLQDKNKYLSEENFRLLQENTNLAELLSNKEKFISTLCSEFKNKEEGLISKINEIQNKFEMSIVSFSEINKKCEKLEKENIDLNSKNTPMNGVSKLSHKEIPFPRKDFLDKKFLSYKYDDKYIIKCLQKDILDFQDYTKEQIRKNKAVVDELLKYVQNSVNECIPDYEVKLYGSHATGLCLNWSDLDIVLVNKRTQYSSNYSALHSLYLNLLDKPWKKTIKFIDTAIIPIIKINSSDEYSSMQMDISLQDGKHYGLKCVELVRSFMTEYEALEPMIFALKNLLKNANLNDPYIGGLSSYGLILMVVSYLQSQLESHKSIKIADGNIGRLFLEFLCYYGLIFDHTKYVIYTYPPNLNFVDKDGRDFFFNMQSGHELIIVDPLNKSNNVARSSYQFVNIKMAFMIGFVVSREECECGCHFNKNSEDTLIINTDHCILKRIFNSVRRFNANSNSQ